MTIEIIYTLEEYLKLIKKHTVASLATGNEEGFLFRGQLLDHQLSEFPPLSRQQVKCI